MVKAYEAFVSFCWMKYAGCVENARLGVVNLEYRPIAYAARVIWGLTGIFVICLLTTITCAYAVLVESSALPAIIGIGVIFSALWWWATGRRWKAWGYAERDKDLVLKRGVLFRRVTIVPYGRMQFVDTTQGPLERMLGVSTVVLNTAAAATDARIPMLKDEEAQRLRDHLTQLGEAYATGL